MYNYGKSKLVLKSKKRKKKKIKEKIQQEIKVEKVKVEKMDDDWWVIEELGQCTNGIAIYFEKFKKYVKQLDNGMLILGDETDGGPQDVEVFTASIINEKVTIKTGYEKYMGLMHLSTQHSRTGNIEARSEAIGPREFWTPVFENNKCALLSANNLFLSLNEDGKLMAIADKVDDDCIIKILSNNTIKSSVANDDTKCMKQTEFNYIKKFQSFENNKYVINKESRRNLRSAKGEGKLYETLLNRREKMKSDKFCK
ncbi:hypothetical protein A3Q56_06766 [Intoshia linei]|uniref:Protein FRG1 n=1 Tax=Intoshia linei TaxID=1819745 RepID=A0A177AU19_9BILA|nr:hypothetical protein A3Q56_06766 [Intoshia linei]